jgi:F0F1-type ATP synthase assembly protein I
LQEKDPKETRETGPRKPTWYSAAEASAIGIEIVVSMGIGYWVGTKIDRHFHTYPWFTILCFLAGVGAAIKAMVRVARQYKRENPDDDAGN